MKILLLLMLFTTAFAGMAFGQDATLQLRVTSQGEPSAARVYVTDVGGWPYRFPDTVAYSKSYESHFYLDGSGSMPMSPGHYTIRVEKGPEYAVVERTVSLEPGKTDTVEIDLPRLVNMNAEDWYSGDLHNHRAPSDVPVMMRAEDLNVAPVITRHVGSNRPVTEPYPQQDLVTVDATHTMGLHVQEVERNGQGEGAVIFMNVPEALDPSLPLLYPTVAMICRKVRDEGGYVDAEKPMWRWVPVGVALGLVDSIGAVNNHFHPHEVAVDTERIGAMNRERPEERTVVGFAEWMTSLYYSYLNCGYRLAASAGSATGVMASWPGYERVYVDLSGPFSYQQWFKDLKAGRSVATNGPLMRVKMNGNPPGNDTEWKPGLAVELDVQIDSQDPLERFEVVHNGKVISKTMLAGRKKWQAKIPVKVTAPGWIAVRCFAPLKDTLRYAQSSPFYFTRNGNLPVQASDAQRWADFIHQMIASADASLYPSHEDFDKAMAEYREAEGIYRGLASRAQAGATH